MNVTLSPDIKKSMIVGWCPFGTGHTPETDPMRKGWFCRLSPFNSGTVYFGRTGHEGTISVNKVGDVVYVLAHEESYKDLLEGLSNGIVPESLQSFTTSFTGAGWILDILKEVESLYGESK